MQYIAYFVIFVLDKTVMTKEELYRYMLAYQQEHMFTKKDQSNFIIVLKGLQADADPKKGKT
ncbi:hypothetical protein [Aquimarina algiphila]|uniref:hypothetical protein n=1 Tax=Aquimarina algiphila TaxID=2047982 RepID=UPI00232E50A1|nr:hypothetical protein [Aquimarina algiphila]